MAIDLEVSGEMTGFELMERRGLKRNNEFMTKCKDVL